MPYGTINVDTVTTSTDGGILGAGNASIMKNRIINGAMVIDQRNAGASVTPTTSAYTLDRWILQVAQSSKLSLQQNAGSVTPPAGFSNYLGVTSTSAYSSASGDFFVVSQLIEGFNVADLNWGTANAKAVTLSFQVRSSLTGTFGGSVISNGAGTYSYPFTYSIPVSNTWTTISVSLPANTFNVPNSTNGYAVQVAFNLGSGTTYQGTANSWQSGAYFAPTGSTSVVGTNGATFYITGVQLEVGSSATGYEYRQYTTELQLCQRYFIRYSGGPELRGIATSGSSCERMGMVLPVPMRTAPTGTLTGTMSVYDGSVARDVTSIANDYSTTQTIEYNLNLSGALTATGRIAAQYQNGAFSLSSEL
jgi:hypothetical protein